MLDDNTHVCKMITVPEKAFDFLALDHWTRKPPVYNQGRQTLWEVEVIEIANQARKVSVKRLTWLDSACFVCAAASPLNPPPLTLNSPPLTASPACPRSRRTCRCCSTGRWASTTLGRKAIVWRV
eukprot:1901044-Pyramimonas_sp.AAC.1